MEFSHIVIFRDMETNQNPRDEDWMILTKNLLFQFKI